MKKGSIIGIGIVVIGIALVSYQFGPLRDQSDIQVNEPAEVVGGSEESTPGGESAKPGIVDVTLETDDYSFNPSLITARPGDTVTVTLENIKGVHDFIIDELDVHTEHVEEPGDTTEVTFVIPEDAEAGSYEFYCSVGNHRELGMVGQLVIE